MDNFINEIQANVWLQMLHDYLVDPQMSYQKLADKYSVPLRTIEFRGLKEQWPAKRAKLILQATERIQKQAENEVVQYKKKIVQLGRLASSKAIKRLMEDDLEPQTAKDVLSYLVEGLKLEGLGLGFDPHQQTQNTSIHIQNSVRPPVYMTWANGLELPPYPDKLIETPEEEAAWLAEQERKKQAQQTQTSGNFAG